MAIHRNLQWNSLEFFRFVKHPSRNDLVEAYAMNRTFEGSQSKGGGNHSERFRP